MPPDCEKWTALQYDGPKPLMCIQALGGMPTPPLLFKPSCSSSSLPIASSPVQRNNDEYGYESRLLALVEHCEQTASEEALVEISASALYKRLRADPEVWNVLDSLASQAPPSATTEVPGVDDMQSAAFDPSGSPSDAHALPRPASTVDGMWWRLLQLLRSRNRVRNAENAWRKMERGWGWRNSRARRRRKHRE